MEKNNGIYIGIIENNDDSANEDQYKLGRCQVRVAGLHSSNRTDTEQKDYLPTDDLIWAQILMPVTTPGEVNKCDTPFLKNGTPVIIQYLDNYKQFPIVMGVLMQIAETQPDFQKGFSDPNSEYPTSEDLNKSPMYPFNSGIIPEHTQSKIDNVSSGTNITEPAPNIDSTAYYTNKVLRSENAIIELDDTDTKERLSLTHVSSGTFIDIHPTGDIIIKSQNDSYKISIANYNELIGGDRNVETGGAENKIVGGDSTEEITGNKNITSAQVTITGNITLTSGTLIADGSAAPTGHGVLCGLQNCIFSGAPHSGHQGTLT